LARRVKLMARAGKRPRGRMATLRVMSEAGKRTPVTPEEFERITGRKATPKYLEWANCSGLSCLHWRCGWCEAEGCNLPLFLCGHPRPPRGA
jgi:hypothetical protein